jgi:hypothetical protein
MDIPKAQEIYRHFKGNMYRILNIAEHTETGEKLVIYQSVDDESKIYARPLDMFMSTVDREKYPDAEQSMRFELVKDEFVLDPEVDAFLDSTTYEEKLKILIDMKPRLTEEKVTTMAFAVDISLPEGDVNTKYESLKKSLLIRERYEGSRLRK